MGRLLFGLTVRVDGLSETALKAYPSFFAETRKDFRKSPNGVFTNKDPYKGSGKVHWS